MDLIISHLIQPILYPVQSTERIYWFYLYSALMAALLVYLIKKPKSSSGDRMSLWSFLFPKSIYAHKSTLLDLKYFYVNSIVQSLVLLPLFAGTNIAVTDLTRTFLDRSNTGVGGILDGSEVAVMLLFTFCVALCMDLGLFIAHTLQHRVGWLWEFHKVHHTAEVLTPLTVYRVHPVDNLLSFGLSGFLAGGVNGVYQYLAAGDGLVANILGVNIFIILFYIMAYNLRHSHIWLSYGPVLSQVLISPAQHQIHHGVDKRHHDKNMGFMFAFWDRWAGSLYVPSSEEDLKFGIDSADQKHFNSVPSLYLRPFLANANSLLSTKAFDMRNASMVGFFAALTTTAVVLNAASTPTPKAINDRVFLENMTWQEVRDAVAAGHTTAIVPTGGTEQNGPHMILGKHNYIVSYTSARIAETLGNTLVAPVVRYVPEGNIEPAEGHMRFSGTLSVPEAVFEAILEHTARSLKAHGFKVICFVGDSKGNQMPQQRVAEKLNRAWESTGVKIVHVGDYYSRNGQRVSLRNKGQVDKVIGGHAGIRDTSELMAVYPDGIRQELLGDNRDRDFASIGANGVSAMASAEIGRRLLEMKVRAGVSQILRQTGEHTLARQ